MMYGGEAIGAVMYGGTEVEAAMYGGGVVWTATPPKPVVKITGKSGFDSLIQMNSALSDYGLARLTVVELPFDVDVSEATTLAGLFSECPYLVTVPKMDTAHITAMNNMFINSWSLVSVPDMQTANVTNMAGMFVNCRALTDGNVRLFGRHPNVNVDRMIEDSGLTQLPFY